MTDLATVIPLRSKHFVGSPNPASAETPEPAALYGLTVIAFCLHTNVGGMCPRCRVVWPCDHVRLAYRLREGF